MNPIRRIAVAPQPFKAGGVIRELAHELHQRVQPDAVVKAQAKRIAELEAALPDAYELECAANYIAVKDAMIGQKPTGWYQSKLNGYAKGLRSVEKIQS